MNLSGLAPRGLRSRILLVVGLTEECGGLLGEPVMVWLRRWQAGPSEAEEAERAVFEELRGEVCKKGRKLWGAAVSPGWQQHLELVTAVAQLLGQAHAIHAGHDYIADQQIDGAFVVLGHGKGLVRCAGRHDAIPG